MKRHPNFTQRLSEIKRTETELNEEEKKRRQKQEEWY